MKKKVMLIGAGFTLGSALLVTSAFANIGSTPGYDSYKEAIKQTVTQTNATRTVEVTLSDNGSRLLKVDSVIKSDEATNAMSASIKVAGGGQQDSFDTYHQDGQMIFKQAGTDVYKVVNPDNEDRDREWGHDGDHEWDGADRFNKQAENVLDALVGNLKNYVEETDNGDGTTTLEMDLNGSRIPAIANAVASLLVTQMGNEDFRDHRHEEIDPAFDKWAAVADQMPKLTDNVRIESVKLTAVKDAKNGIVEQDVTVEISGKDNEGDTHELTLTANIDASAIGSTTPERVDLTGKKVETIKDRE